MHLHMHCRNAFAYALRELVDSMDWFKTGWVDWLKWMGGWVQMDGWIGLVGAEWIGGLVLLVWSWIGGSVDWSCWYGHGSVDRF